MERSEETSETVCVSDCAVRLSGDLVTLLLLGGVDRVYRVTLWEDGSGVLGGALVRRRESRVVVSTAVEEDVLYVKTAVCVAGD